MPIPAWSPADFLSAFLKLLPRGRPWATASDATMPQALATLMPTYSRLAARDANLLVDAFPATTDELLPEWQYSLGLPDPCAGPSPGLQQSRAQVVARLAVGGGQSIPYFITFAANLGYAITITPFTPFRAGVGRAGGAIMGDDWAYAWQVNAPNITVTYFRAGLSAVGEPLATLGNAVLQCEIRRLAPAHTTVLFNFGSA